MRFPYKNAAPLQIGIYRQQGYFDFVWFDRENRPQVYQTFVNDGEIKRDLLQHLQQQIGTRVALRFVGCISAHLTWTKSLILPNILTAQECHQQCQFVLEKELPIPLNELWFDYTSAPLKQGFRLDICAIRQETAHNFLQNLQPFKLNVLDITTHAIMRAFHYLLGAKARSGNALFLFQNEVFSLAVSETSHQVQSLQTQENLTALFAQFQQRYPEPVEQIFVYQTPAVKSNLPESWQVVNTELPFIALGNALWQTSLFQAPHFAGENTQ